MPAKKPVVIVVHGMGSHKPGAFKKEFIDATNAAMNRYKGFKTKRIENEVDIEEINYDGFFDEIRTKMADDAKPIADRLGTIGAISGLDWGAEFVLKLTNVEAEFGKDEFLYTHLLDVVFYATLLGGKVRVDAANKIAKVIKDNEGSKIHIVAHSLGTAVLHDTLALLYRKDFDISDDIPDLSIDTHKLSSVWMVANVSALMNSLTDLTDPYKSTVQPTTSGCTNFMINVRHELDPFTWIQRFDPPNDGSWIPAEFYDFAYLPIRTSAIRKINTHDFTEYMENPNVALPLLAQLVRLNPKQEEILDVNAEYRKDDIVGAFDELKDALDDIDVTKKSTLKSLAATAKKFHVIFERFQEEIDALKSTTQ